MDDEIKLRLASQGLYQDIRRAESWLAQSGVSVVAARTRNYSGSYPTTVNVFYELEPYIITGTETEGATATETATGTLLYGWHGGSVVPPLGARVLAHRVPYRWEFLY